MSLQSGTKQSWISVLDFADINFRLSIYTKTSHKFQVALPLRYTVFHIILTAAHCDEHIEVFNDFGLRNIVILDKNSQQILPLFVRIIVAFANIIAIQSKDRVLCHWDMSEAAGGPINFQLAHDTIEVSIMEELVLGNEILMAVCAVIYVNRGFAASTS